MDAALPPCPVGGERPLTPGEVDLARSVFGTAVDYAKVRIRRRKWFPLHPRRVTMAPRGHIYFHPLGRSYCDDFATAALNLKAHFIHEMTHVWQVQTRGDWYLVLNRMPWARYDYSIKPGWRLTQYGIEQQAEIVKHAFLLRSGASVAGISDRRVYDGLVAFPGAA